MKTSLDGDWSPKHHDEYVAGKPADQRCLQYNNSIASEPLKMQTLEMILSSLRTLLTREHHGLVSAADSRKARHLGRGMMTESDGVVGQMISESLSKAARHRP